MQTFYREEAENVGAQFKSKAAVSGHRTALGTINLNSAFEKRHSSEEARQANRVPRVKTLYLTRRGAAKWTRDREDARDRLPEGVEDIDLKNHLLAHPYAADIFRYLRRSELENPVKSNHLEGQQITPRMRAILVDWLCDVSTHFKLIQETLHLAVHLVDRFMQADRRTTKENLQLLGMTAVFVAAKYEEVYPLEANDLVRISDGAFGPRQLLRAEEDLVNALGFRIGAPVAITFLRRYSKAARAEPLQHAYGKYFIDLALTDYAFCCVRPSLVAAVAAYVALCVSRNSVSPALWTPALVHYSTYYYRDFEALVPQLAKTIVQATDSKLRAVWTKYSTVENHSVSLMPTLLPATGIVNQLCR